MQTEEMKFGLSDLEVGDDLDVSLDNDTYQDQANPAPPAAGKYNAIMLSLDPRRNKEKKLILEDGKFPIFTIGMVDLIEGLGDGVTRKTVLYQDVKTKPFSRAGVAVSNIGDLTRALGTPNWTGLDPKDPDSGVSRLKEAFETRTPFAAQYDWGVYDAVFIANALAQLEIPEKDQRDDDQKKIVNAIYKAGRITGMRFFPFNSEKNTFSHVLVRDNVPFTNPATGGVVVIEGERRALEARLTITRYFPKSDVESGRVHFGPSKVKPAVVAG